jgi:heterodisulfide reductase subunit B
MKTYQYYPGCSVKGTGKAYEESLLAVFEALGVGLEELADWNCCGATAYMSIDEGEAFVLAGRNLALAERKSADLVAPCSACYLVLNKTQDHMKSYPQVRQRVTSALAAGGLTYKGGVRVRHPLDVLINDVGLETISGRVTQPLKGVRIAPYYGCQIVRPYATFDSSHRPVSMDRLLEVTGAEVIDYPPKTRCCGASQTGTLPEVGLDLVRMLLVEARERGADLVSTVCPLCQFNLDVYQDEIVRRGEPGTIPVVYFTQVLGVAMGLSARKLGLARNIVPAEPLLFGRTADV